MSRLSTRHPQPRKLFAAILATTVVRWSFGKGVVIVAVYTVMASSSLGGADSLTRSTTDHIVRSSGSDEGEGEWQDERCQGPIQSNPGTSTLCNACRYIFSEYQVYGNLGIEDIEKSAGMHKVSTWGRHLKWLEVLEQSARRSCAFCRLILAKIQRQSRKFKPAEAAKINCRIWLNEGDGSPHMDITYNGYDIPSGSIRRSEPMEFGLAFQSGQSERLC